MNLNLIIKSAVATALLSATSIPAFATSVAPPPSGPTPVPDAGNGGLIVEVWDTSAGTSLAEWLGGDYGTLGSPATTAQTLDYGVLDGSNFSTLFSASDVAAGDVRFLVTAVNTSSPSTPEADVTVSTLGTVRGSALGTFSSDINTGISALMNGTTACNNVNPCTATSTGAATYTASSSDLGQLQMGSSKLTGLAGGAALDFYQITNPGGGTGTTLTPTEFANGANVATWTLSAAGDLVYNVAGSPVPLPAAIWLLGSGLLGLAGIGRRKVAAA